MTQREEPRTQNVELQAMGNDSQILKVIKKVPVFSWLDFRIVMDQGLLYASHFPLFLSRNVFKHDPMPVPPLCVGYVGAGNVSLSGFVKQQFQSNSLLEPTFEELHPGALSIPEPDLDDNILDSQLMLSWDETLGDLRKGQLHQLHFACGRGRSHWGPVGSL